VIIVEALPDYDFSCHAIAASGAIVRSPPGIPDFLVTPAWFSGLPRRDLLRSNIGGQVLMKKAKFARRRSARAGSRAGN
jgi:hypothetical protein